MLGFENPANSIQGISTYVLRTAWVGNHSLFAFTKLFLQAAALQQLFEAPQSSADWFAVVHTHP